MNQLEVEKSEKQQSIFFPRKIVIIAVTITAVVFCIMILAAIYGYVHTSVNQQKLHVLQTAFHEVINYDETRTSTVLLAVARNDITKKQDYDQINERIRSGITALKPLLSTRREMDALSALSASISRLNTVEERIFNYLAGGQYVDAYNQIVGASYAADLDAYYNNTRSLSGIVAKKINDETRDDQLLSLIAALFIVFLTPVITLLWILIFLLYIKNKKQYEASQAQLELSRAQYTGLVEQNNDGIIVLQDGQVKFGNKKLFTLFEYAPEDIIHKSFIDYVAPEHRALVAKRYADRLAGKDVESRYEFELLAKNGEHIPILVSSSLTVFEGRPATMAIVRDMRHEKKLEQMRYDFVSIASHQLRTPLTGVKWFTELLLGNKNKNLTRAQKDYVNNIYESNQRMIHLVDDLLDVSHIQEGSKFPIVPKLTNMIQLARESISRQRILAKSKKITIRCLAQKNEKVMMHVDTEKILQVFQNLLSNAIKYSPVRSVIEVGCTPKKEKIVFFVRDHGVGIPHDEQQRIFEKFFRGSNVKTTEAGSGLGLYIVRAIVEGHGGTAWFESQEQKGSTFYFSLPIIL